MPTGVTSVVVPQQRQTAENVQTQAKETTKQADVTPTVVQPVREALSNPPAQAAEQKPEGAKPQVKEEDRQHLEMYAIKGLMLVDLDQSLRKLYAIKDTVKGGVIISQVDPNSPAAGKGLSPGNVIVKIAQEGVASTGDVLAKIDKLKKQGRNSASLLVADGDGATRLLTVNIQ